MAEIIPLIIVILLPIAWLASEFRAPRSVRITLGILCMLVLTSAWMFSRQRTYIHNASNAAVVRMLGEAINRGDIDTAKEAIDIYNAEENWHPGFTTIDFLADQESPQKP